MRFSPVINDVGIVLVCASSRDLTEPCENICYCCPFSIRKRIEEKLFFYFLNTFFFFIVVGTKVQDRAVENPSVCEVHCAYSVLCVAIMRLLALERIAGITCLSLTH